MARSCAVPGDALCCTVLYHGHWDPCALLGWPSCATSPVPRQGVAVTVPCPLCHVAVSRCPSRAVAVAMPVTVTVLCPLCRAVTVAMS